MAIAGGGIAQQFLQQPMHGGRGEEVAAANDVAHLLQMIIDDDGEVVGRRPLLAAQHDIAPGFRLRFDSALLGAFIIFAPGERRADEIARASDVEPQSRRFARRQTLARLSRGHRDAAAPMQRRAVGIVRAHAPLGDLAAGAEAGEDETARLEFRQGLCVVFQMFALAAPRSVEYDPEPGEIIDDRSFELGLAARRIGVLDAQQETAMQRFRPARVAKRGISVAEMQPAIGRRGEAEGMT